MKFVVSFHYMDGKDFEIEVLPEDMEKFIESVGKQEVYFNESKGVGIWIPIEKVRYFHVERVDEDGNRVLAATSDLTKEPEDDQSEDCV